MKRRLAPILILAAAMAAPVMAGEPLPDSVVRADGDYVVWHDNGDDIAHILEEDGRSRLVEWLWRGRWVRAEFDVDGDGHRDVLGVASAEGSWNWYRYEREQFLPCAIKPKAEDPLSQAVRTSIATLLERRLRLDDGLSTAVPEASPLPTAAPFADYGEPVRVQVSVRFNAAAPPETPITVRPGESAPVLDPAQVLQGEPYRRQRFQALELPAMETRVFEPSILPEPYRTRVIDALEVGPGAAARVDASVFVYRVFEPRAVSPDDGVFRDRIQVCLDVAIEAFAADHFCVDEERPDEGSIFASVPATDPAARTNGTWFVEIHAVSGGETAAPRR